MPSTLRVVLALAAVAALSPQELKTLAQAGIGTPARAGRVVPIPTDVPPARAVLLDKAYPAEVGSRNALVVVPAGGERRRPR